MTLISLEIKTPEDQSLEIQNSRILQPKILMNCSILWLILKMILRPLSSKRLTERLPLRCSCRQIRAPERVNLRAQVDSLDGLRS